MDRENIQSRHGEDGQESVIDLTNEEAPIYLRYDEKIEVEIREVIRIRPQDFAILKDSFERWAQKWD